MQVEHRGRPGLELRAVEGRTLPTIYGMPIVFNRMSEPMRDYAGRSFREQVMPSFAEPLRRIDADLRALVGHDGEKVIGRQKSGTLRVDVRAEGVAVEIDPPETSYGRDIVESVRRGDIDGMSFGFTAAEDEWTETDGGELMRSLVAGETMEVSIVSFPAYPDTSVAVRSLKRWEECHASEIEEAHKRRQRELDLTTAKAAVIFDGMK